MKVQKRIAGYHARLKGKAYPPGRSKIADALKLLLEEKEFNAITTYEIARKAGVAEGLIYKYFEDKRDLLHQVLSDYLEEFIDQIKQSLEGIKGARTKLKTLIGRLIHLYITNRVFAKIILLEVRNFPGYFESETYEKAKEYSRLILDLIKEGMKKGEIRDDVSPSSFRQVILGGMEHLILPAIIFNLEVDPDSLSDDLFKIIFHE